MNRSLPALILLLAVGTVVPAEETAPLSLALRKRVETKPGSGRFHTVVEKASWNPKKTALIVCDMWDLHHCLNATRRGGELAPRMNELLKQARKLGVTIIHAPSSCMDTYRDHPARKLALSVPRAKSFPAEIGKWCYKIPEEEKGKYPIDQSDGGEDDEAEEHRVWAEKLKAMGRNPRAPWKSQIAQLEIMPGDYLTDSGEEVWSILEHKELGNVLMVGVHTNMCVLGRPFGLRQLARNGKKVVLFRDMTDTMYNPARAPYVSHFTGTDLIIEHIEKWVCPTATSDQILGGKPFRFAGDRRPHVVVLAAEDEYRTEVTLPAFALAHLGKTCKVSFVFANDKVRHELPGIEVLADADVVLVSVRRRLLPPGQMAILRKYIEAGKPVVGIRTASHAFSTGIGKAPEGYQAFKEFDRDILGGNYSGHHPEGPRTAIARVAGVKDHPILAGVKLEGFEGIGGLYKVNPLSKSATPLLLGSIAGKPAEPIAWVNTSKYGGRVFYTSLGHVSDFAQPAFNRMLTNAVLWAAGVPVEKTAAGG